MQKELREAKAEVAELTEKYQKEMLLRKKYYNIIEDMKGKVRVYCRSRPISSTEKERGNFNIVESSDEFTVKIRDRNFSGTARHRHTCRAVPKLKVANRHSSARHAGTVFEDFIDLRSPPRC